MFAKYLDTRSQLSFSLKWFLKFFLLAVFLTFISTSTFAKEKKLHKQIRKGLELPVSHFIDTADIYKNFPTSESETHPSSGPHASFGHPVKVYMNATMNDAFKAGAKVLPKGAGTVKELFDNDGGLDGWAVMLKTQDASDGGKGWFWYEITSTTDSSAPRANGNGVARCAGCHSVGNDFVLTEHPLK